MSTTISVNGEPRALESATVADLLTAEGIAAPARGLAVAVNGAVLPKGRWDRPLAPGDAVEIVRAMQGG